MTPKNKSRSPCLSNACLIPLVTTYCILIYKDTSQLVSTSLGSWNKVVIAQAVNHIPFLAAGLCNGTKLNTGVAHIRREYTGSKPVEALFGLLIGDSACALLTTHAP